jgi:hypothetical protein
LRHLDAAKTPPVFRQRVQQGRRLANPGRHDDHVAVTQQVECLLGRHLFVLVHLMCSLHRVLLMVPL